MLAALCFAFLCGLTVKGLSVPVLPEDHCARCPTELATNDPNVLRAAYFAVGQLGPGRWLVKVQRAHSERRVEPTDRPHQTIDVGLNYYLLLKLWENKYPMPGPRHCRVTVWAKLDGSMEMTISNC